MRIRLLATCLAIAAVSMSAGSARASAPFDLVWDTVDDNGFPKNPRWAKQDAYLKAPGQRKSIATQYPAAPPAYVHAPAPAKTQVTTAAPAKVTPKSGFTPPSAKPATVPIIDDDNKLVRALCAAHGGKVPSAPPDYCTKGVTR